MRFLVDQNLAADIAVLLSESGHDAVHTRDMEASRAPDEALVVMAAADDRVIVSADTDFGAILASTHAVKPSVVLVREVVDLPPVELVSLLLRQLAAIEPHLASGAIAALSAGGARLRPLPL